jgi:hypothetical protein
MNKLGASIGIFFGVTFSAVIMIMVVIVGVACLYCTGCKIPEIDLPDMPDTLPSPLPSTTTTTTIPPQNVGEPPIKWLGKDYSKLPVTMELKGGAIKSTLRLDNPAPADWPRKEVKVEVQAIICFFEEVNGVTTGGKFDWCRPNQVVKDLKNLHNGYNGHKPPSPFTRKYTCLVSVDEKQRSKIIELRND